MELRLGLREEDGGEGRGLIQLKGQRNRHQRWVPLPRVAVAQGGGREEEVGPTASAA